MNLSNTSFNNRLRTGVPFEIPMSHKIGTFNNSVMSDCGIIYEPKRPYVLCIMLEVADDQTGNEHFATLSKMTYDYIHSHKQYRYKGLVGRENILKHPLTGADIEHLLTGDKEYQAVAFRHR